MSRQSLASLAILAEGVSRLTKLKKIDHNNAQKFSSAIIDRLESLAPGKLRTITYDNGKENVSHQHINASLELNRSSATPINPGKKVQ